MDIHIDKPKLNRSTSEENIAILDKWISETADKMNAFILQVNRERSNNGNNKTAL